MITILSRFGSPLFLALALVCFCLPWIEIRASSPAGYPVWVATQSGLQMTFGSFTGMIHGPVDIGGEFGGGQPSQNGIPEWYKSLRNAIRTSPAMGVYDLCLHFVGVRVVPASVEPSIVVCGLCLAIGLVAGLLVSRKMLRTAVVCLCASLAFATLMFQLAIGFAPVQFKPSGNTHLTVWFWLGTASAIGACVTALCDGFLPTTKTGPAKDSQTIEVPVADTDAGLQQ